MSVAKTFLTLVLTLTSFIFVQPFAQAQTSKTSQSQNTQLTAYDIKIIADYTGRGYFINPILANVIDAESVPGLHGPMYLQFQPDAEDQYIFAAVRYSSHLNRALDKIPSYRSGDKNLVYRGVYSTSERPEDRYPKGKIWIERRYSSATTDREVAKKFAMGALKNEGCGGCPPDVQNPKVAHATLIEIESLSGKQIVNWSLKKDEKEVLFKSGAIFKVVDARRDDRGRYAVKLKELLFENMTHEEKEKLAQFENQRISKKLQEFFANDQKLLSETIEKWNTLYALWIEKNIFNQEIDLDSMSSGG